MAQFVHSVTGGRVVSTGGRRVGSDQNCCWQQSRLCTTGNPSGKWLPVPKIPASRVIVENGVCYIFQNGDPTTICTPPIANRHTQPPIGVETNCDDDVCHQTCLSFCCRSACGDGYVACIDSVDVTLMSVQFPTAPVDSGAFTGLMVGDPNGLTIRCFFGGSWTFVSDVVSGYTYTLTDDDPPYAVWYTLSGIQVNVEFPVFIYNPTGFNDPNPFIVENTDRGLLTGQCVTDETTDPPTVYTNAVANRIMVQMGAGSASYGGPSPPGGCAMPPGNLFYFGPENYSSDDEFQAVRNAVQCESAYSFPNIPCTVPEDGGDGTQPCINAGIGCGGTATIKVNWTCRQIA